MYEQLQDSSSGTKEYVPTVTFNVSLMELIRAQVQQQLQQQQQPGLGGQLRQVELPEAVYDYVQPLNERNREYLSLVHVPSQVAGMQREVQKFQKEYGVRVVAHTHCTGPGSGHGQGTIENKIAFQ